ncbi:unnamed protein product [Arabidopsis halleri]
MLINVVKIITKGGPAEDKNKEKHISLVNHYYHS